MQYENRTLYIAYASDDSFAEIMGVSMISLFENNMDVENLILYILDSGISEENKKKINSICEWYHRPEPAWVEVGDISVRLQIDVTLDRGSIGQYARLFISSALPDAVHRVLYLDCDTVIHKSLHELWTMELHGCTIAALKDAFSRQYRGNIGLEPEDIMFNSGVMLIDLDQWREKKTEDRLLAFIKERKGRIQQGDQGALNAILSKETCCFAPRFNAVTIFFDFTYEEMLIYRKPPEFYPRAMVLEAVEAPVIIHYTTSFLSKRPWVEGCAHRYSRRWLEYWKKSPWGRGRLRAGRQKGLMKRMYILVFRLLPRAISIRLSGLLQAYGRPFLNRYLV